MSLRRSLFLGTAAVVAIAAVAGAQARPVASARTATTALAAPARANYAIDATHSELSFRIRHLIGRVNGTFTKWSGSIAIDSTDWSRSTVDVAIETASIDTREPRRDGHLRSNDFFAADSFPTITFKSTKVERTGSKLKITGDLTIRGRTKPAVLVGEYVGAGKDPQGQQRVAFSAQTTVNRLDYGVSWNRAVETGAMLGDEVTIDVTIEAVRKG